MMADLQFTFLVKIVLSDSNALNFGATLISYKLIQDIWITHNLFFPFQLFHPSVGSWLTLDSFSIHPAVYGLSTTKRRSSWKHLQELLISVPMLQELELWLSVWKPNIASRWRIIWILLVSVYSSFGHNTAGKILKILSDGKSGVLEDTYLIGQNFGGQKCRKSGLLPNILSAENFFRRKFFMPKYFVG